MKSNLLIKSALCIVLSFVAMGAMAQKARLKPRMQAVAKYYLYRVYLHDKQGTPYRLDRPQEFLSERSIARRQRQGLSLDSTDLPVSPRYVKRLQHDGYKVMGTSRWQNTALVSSPDSDVVSRLAGVAWIDSVKRVYASPDSIRMATADSVANVLHTDTLARGRYGDGYWQINRLNGIPLHEAGFRGRGMLIAILDAGYHNADRSQAFRGVDIVGTFDRSPMRSASVYREHYHGAMVLSCMAMNRPDTIIGTAPEASYALIRTEDTRQETPSEEDSWTMGAELADSLGADLINSSLGYTGWDAGYAPIHLSQLDGRTTFISRTASMLARKGIVLCNSAGNSAADSWHKIGVPADAAGILTVGAIDGKARSARFSSLGPSQDGRVKPDVVSPGAPAYVIDGQGNLTTANGTSFSSPILCGMVACLWQALPQLTASQIIALVQRSADRYAQPDNVYGYGVPDFWKAYQMGVGSKSKE